MKSVLFAGAALMIGASIYGFVDLQKNSHKKEFNNLYREEPVKTVPVTLADEPEAPLAVTKEKKEIVSMKTSPANKKETVKTSKRLQPVSADERLETSVATTIEQAAVSVSVSPENEGEKKVVKKKKKISTKLFSRAPIREEEISFDAELPAKELKKEKSND